MNVNVIAIQILIPAFDGYDWCIVGKLSVQFVLYVFPVDSRTDFFKEIRHFYKSRGINAEQVYLHIYSIHT